MADTDATETQAPKDSSSSIKKKPAGLASPHLASLSLPESRQQTYEELYGPPENILEIEVHASLAGSFAPTRSHHLDTLC